MAAHTSLSLRFANSQQSASAEGWHRYSGALSDNRFRRVGVLFVEFLLVDTLVSLGEGAEEIVEPDHLALLQLKFLEDADRVADEGVARGEKHHCRKERDLPLHQQPG